MSIECGQEIAVKDHFGARAYRFIGQCGGRFITISPGSYLNGYLLMDWRAVLRELITMTVPISLHLEKGKVAESMAGGLYHNLPLSYPLSIKGLAELLGEDATEVEAVLKDLAVQAE